MADFFINYKKRDRSYKKRDRDWAFWIAKELEALDHIRHIHEWEIKGGGDIYAWMSDNQPFKSSRQYSSS
jgi:hypothetical protein